MWEMALEACSFQVGTIVASTATPSSRVRLLLHGRKPFPPKEKLNLLTSSLSRRAISVRRRTQVVCQAKNVVDEVLVANDKNWNSLVISCESPVLVDFWAPWCGPCRMIAPVIDELAKDYAGKIVCCKVNTDECPNIASDYGIRSIPTVLMFKNGEKKESVIGAVPKSTLSGIIEKYLET